MINVTDAHQLRAEAALASGDESLSRRADTMNRRLLELAAEDKWQQIEDIVTRRNDLLSRIPAGEREHALLTARHCTEKLHTIAQAAKSRCAEQLAALKRGRQAAASYRANR